jgi:antitoxin YefM
MLGRVRRGLRTKAAADSGGICPPLPLPDKLDGFHAQPGQQNEQEKHPGGMDCKGILLCSSKSRAALAMRLSPTLLPRHATAADEASARRSRALGQWRTPAPVSRLSTEANCPVAPIAARTALVSVATPCPLSNREPTSCMLRANGFAHGSRRGSLLTLPGFLVILLTMTVLPLGDVKSHLSELVGRVHDHHERVTVTVHGRPSAILIAPEDLEALEETLEIMRDAATMNRLAESDAELARGEYVSAGELAEAMRRRRAQ